MPHSLSELRENLYHLDGYLMSVLHKEIIKQIKRRRIKWQRHAFERMLERDISRSNVIQVLLNGKLIENYPEDNPFSSGLFLGFTKEKPLHVVAAIDREEDGVILLLHIIRMKTILNQIIKPGKNEN